jgi:chromosome segregation ATPase
VDTAIDKSTEAFEDAVELKSSLSMKSAEVQDIARKLTAAQDKLQPIESDIDNFSTDITVVQSSLEKIELSIQNFNENRINQAVELVGLIGDGGEEFLDQQQTILEKQTKNETEITTLDEKVSRLEDSLGTGLSDLERKNDEQQQTIDDLNAVVPDNLSSKIEQLQDKNDEQQQIMDDLKAEVYDNLILRIEQLENKIVEPESWLN